MYVVANAEGGVALESGYHLDYELLDLGLDSRAASIEGGKQGAYEFGLSYDRIPHRISDTGETIFSGSDDLSLPGGWVRAGSTAGMTALGTSLRPVDVGYDRDRYGANGRFFLGDKWTFGLDYKRDERSGTRPRYGSFGSVSTEMLRPIDDSTDRINADVRYQGKHWFAQFGYFASIYDTKAAGFQFDNPFNAAAAGGDAGRMSLEPDNLYNEVAVSFGWFGLPGNMAVTLSAAMGQGSQETGFNPYTINPNVAVDALPFDNLDGDISVTRADLAVSARPMDRLRLRGSAAYDERDNDSRQGTFTSIVHTDLFPIVDDRVNAVYGYERTRLNGSADFDVYDDLAIGVGGEWRNTDRTGSALEVSGEEVLDGWGRVQFRPSGYLGIVAKGGVEERDPDRYDVNVAAGFGQNPLMRKYNHGVPLPLLRRVARQRRGRIAAAVARRKRVLRRRQLPAVGPGPGFGSRSPLWRRPELDGQREDRGLCDARARKNRLAHERQQHLHDGRLGGAGAGRLRDVRRGRQRAVHGQDRRQPRLLVRRGQFAHAHHGRRRRHLPGRKERAQLVQGRGDVRVQRAHRPAGSRGGTRRSRRATGRTTRSRQPCRRCWAWASTPTTTT